MTAGCPVPIVMAGGKKLPELDALRWPTTPSRGRGRRRHGPQHLPERRPDRDAPGRPQGRPRGLHARAGLRGLRDGAPRSCDRPGGGRGGRGRHRARTAPRRGSAPDRRHDHGRPGHPGRRDRGARGGRRRDGPHRRHGRRLLPDVHGRPADREGDPDAAPQGRPPDDRRPAGEGGRLRRGRRRHDHVPRRGRPAAAPRPAGAGRGDERQRPGARDHPRHRPQPEHARRGARAAPRRGRLRPGPRDQPGLGRPGLPGLHRAPAGRGSAS